MDILTPKTIKLFYTDNPESKIPLLFWIEKINKKKYQTPQEIILDFKKSDYIWNQRIIFNIGHNKFRLVVAFDFIRSVAFIKFIGNHKDYDKIDPKTIEYYKK